MNQTTPRSLNDLTKACTAFQDWPTFAEAMDRGYVPTLQPCRGRSGYVRKRNADVAELADRLESLGYRVWRGSN